HKEHKESRSVKENRNYKGNRDKDSRAPKMKAEKNKNRIAEVRESMFAISMKKAMSPFRYLKSRTPKNAEYSAEYSVCLRKAVKRNEKTETEISKESGDNSRNAVWE
ncbi:MAG: hypothetical protein Q4A41_00430, partial [Bacillota bacterium]|nr:hypothetical protein [Bacillota bacterium]